MNKIQDTPDPKPFRILDIYTEVQVDMFNGFAKTLYATTTTTPFPIYFKQGGVWYHLTLENVRATKEESEALNKALQVYVDNFTLDEALELYNRL